VEGVWVARGRVDRRIAGGGGGGGGRGDRNTINFEEQWTIDRGV
jgi:hypothetical protein